MGRMIAPGVLAALVSMGPPEHTVYKRSDKNIVKKLKLRTVNKNRKKEKTARKARRKNR